MPSAFLFDSVTLITAFVIMMMMMIIIIIISKLPAVHVIKVSLRQRKETIFKI